MRHSTARPFRESLRGRKRQAVGGSPRRGFSVIELTMTLLVIGIVAAAAGLRFAPALQQHRVAGAARRLAGDLARARHAARHSNRSVTVTFDAQGSRYTIAPLLSSSGTAMSETVELNAGPAAATVQGLSLGGDSVLVFNAFGVPDSAGSVVLQSGSASRTVQVSAGTGAIVLP